MYGVESRANCIENFVLVYGGDTDDCFSELLELGLQCFVTLIVSKIVKTTRGHVCLQALETIVDCSQDGVLIC